MTAVLGHDSGDPVTNGPVTNKRVTKGPITNEPARGRRPRLVHVDNMRPLKQAGGIGTHALLIFGPPASVATGGALLVTHGTRFAFMFMSAAMLVYAYPELPRDRLRVFWRRRLLAVLIPYVTWTVVYF